MEWELLQAAAVGDLPRLQLLLRNGGSSITDTTSTGLTASHVAALAGELPTLKWLLTVGGASIADACAPHTKYGGYTALLLAALSRRKATVQWLLLSGGASIREKSTFGSTAIMLAARNGHLPTIQWLIEEGGANIDDVTDRWYHYTVITIAAINGQLPTMQWLIEYGGVPVNTTVWYSLRAPLWAGARDPASMTCLLRAMVLRDVPPADFGAAITLAPERYQLPTLSVGDAQVMQEGARLRARLPAYLVRRRALLDAHSPLLAPLQAIVSGYEERTTTEEIWATGLGAVTKRRARSPRAASLLRRSARLCQRCEL
jgi:hypothetical protein